MVARENLGAGVVIIVLVVAAAVVGAAIIGDVWWQHLVVDDNNVVPLRFVPHDLLEVAWRDVVVLAVPRASESAKSASESAKSAAPPRHGDDETAPDE